MYPRIGKPFVEQWYLIEFNKNAGTKLELRSVCHFHSVYFVVFILSSQYFIMLKNYIKNEIARSPVSYRQAFRTSFSHTAAHCHMAYNFNPIYRGKNVLAAHY